jgi:hypothetical protein
VNLAEHRGPSTIMACQLCAGMAATESLKILLGRGKLVVAPRGLHFDAYRSKLVTTWRPGGNNNPLQRIAFAIARRQLARMAPREPDRNERTFHAQENPRPRALGAQRVTIPSRGASRSSLTTT